jgi:hypothetical protein
LAERFRDAVIGDVEKALVQAGGTKGVGDARAIWQMRGIHAG